MVPVRKPTILHVFGGPLRNSRVVDVGLDGEWRVERACWIEGERSRLQTTHQTCLV